MPKPRSKKKRFWSQPSVQPKPEELNHSEFLNRELSWIQFNRRVLFEAQDERTPLLERLRFLGIVTSNLDEFFMKRVGKLMRKTAAGFDSPSLDGTPPSEQLKTIRAEILNTISAQASCFKEQIIPSLLKQGVQLLHWTDLTEEERGIAKQYFRNNIFSALTPLAVDPGHPFPFISNLSTSLGVTVQYPDREERLFARVKVPRNLAQWIALKPGSAEGGYRFLSLHELVREHLSELFPQMTISDVMPFRVTRSADLDRDDEDAEDLLEMIEQELYQRRFAPVVRLEHGANPPPGMLRFLLDELEITEAEVYEMPSELDFTTLSPLFDLNLAHLKHRPWVPVTPSLLVDDEANILSIIRNQDILVHHPYESFVSTVERFVRTAVEDPKVLAIKMTIYRTGDNSPFMPLLIQAARAGKQVVCVVELTASFDEERNIYWAQALEKAGVHVIYGIVGLKTHAKAILVVRQESDGLRSYAHIGTGNYSLHTASVYTDLGLFTCDPEINEDLVNLFHSLTGRSLKTDYKKLLVSPVNMLERFIACIERERDNAKKGLPTGIIAKMNALDEYSICRALYAASQAGVKIDLLVRGPCTLRAGVPGLSENIRVISVVGRLLEHSRMFYFRAGAESETDGEFLMGSADWMYRNLHARVEVVAPVKEVHQRKRCWEIFQTMLQDRRSAWDMLPDGTYRQRVLGEEDLKKQPPDSADQYQGTHDRLMQLTRQANKIERSGERNGEVEQHAQEAHAKNESGNVVVGTFTRNTSDK